MTIKADYLIRPCMRRKRGFRRAYVAACRPLPLRASIANFVKAELL